MASNPPHDSALATESLSERLREAARTAGFDLCGFAPAITPPTYPRFLDWLDAGHAAGMSYLETRREAYAHPRGVLDGARSVVMLAMNYHNNSKDAGNPDQISNSTGRVARYAQIERDYHDILRQRLRSLCDWLAAERPGCVARGIVDTAPLLERDFARLAGLGWFGKNTLLINRKLGSWLFLAAIVTDLDLPADRQFAASHCGTCTRCLDACPTDAFPEPYVLDARKCIAYWTIEHRGTIPDDVKPGLGDWLFGCDICQEVCPWNRKAPQASDPAMAARSHLSHLDALELLGLDDGQFKARFRGTPLDRPKLEGLQRNAAVVLGNRGDRSALPALREGLTHPHAAVREACQWAIAQIESRTV